MKTRILHLGLGRFHRAHQAVYYQRLFEQFGEEWGVAAFSMRSPDASDELRSVKYRYPVIEFGKTSATIWIDCIQQSFFTKRDQQSLMNFFSSKDISIITLTVTEKAYVKSTDPESLAGLLFEGLRHRRNSAQPGLTVLSCDNLIGNGNRLRDLVLDYGEYVNDPFTCGWIEENIKFPNTMVDRIVPALTPARLLELQQRFDIDNRELVATEVFSQWVIENTFLQPFPPLEKVGAQIVSDVSAFEEVKLRLLNASHSFIAYSGLLKSYTYVHEAIADHEIADMLNQLHNEIIPLLNVPAGLDIQSYRARMMERFDNPELPHQLRQIAMDGSQKLAQRIFPSILQAQKLNLPYVHLATCVENWLRYCYQNVPDDPLREKIESAKRSSSDFAQFKRILTTHLDLK